MDILNKLTKWRLVLAGWQLGTRSTADAEAQAVRDHREATLMLRAEMSALVGLLISKGVFTEEAWTGAVRVAAADLDQLLERRFPGFHTNEQGVTIDVEVARTTMKGWRP